MRGLRTDGRPALAIALAVAVAVLGCGEGTPAPRVAAARAQPVVIPGPPARGLRVDLGDQVHHARALVKQPDGSYRSACLDAADGSLRVRAARAGGQPDGRP